MEERDEIEEIIEAFNEEIEAAVGLMAFDDEEKGPLALADMAMENLEVAEAALRALPIYAKSDYRVEYGQAMVSKLKALIFKKDGELEKAREHYREAFRILFNVMNEAETRMIEDGQIPAEMEMGSHAHYFLMAANRFAGMAYHLAELSVDEAEVESFVQAGIRVCKDAAAYEMEPDMKARLYVMIGKGYAHLDNLVETNNYMKKALKEEISDEMRESLERKLRGFLGA